MKKILFVLFLVLGALSCTTEENYVSNSVSFEQSYTIESSHWNLYDDGYDTYFYYEFNEPDLTGDLYSRGSFIGYIAQTLKGKEYLTPLPFSVFSMDETGYKWEEQYTCSFSPGRVRFIMNVDDFDMRFTPSTRTFVVKYMIGN